MQYCESAVVRDVACLDPVWHHATLEVRKPQRGTYPSVRTDWSDAVSFDRSVGTTEGGLETYRIPIVRDVGTSIKSQIETPPNVVCRRRN